MSDPSEFGNQKAPKTRCTRKHKNRPTAGVGARVFIYGNVIIIIYFIREGRRYRVLRFLRVATRHYTRTHYNI